MAQVHCGHCGATGTRYAGEDSIEIAELRAIKAWNDATEGPRGFAHRAIAVTNPMVFLSVLLILISYFIFDGFNIQVFASLMVACVVIGVIARLNLRFKRQRSDARYWDMIESLELSAQRDDH